MPLADVRQARELLAVVADDDLTLKQASQLAYDEGMCSGLSLDDLREVLHKMQILFVVKEKYVEGIARCVPGDDRGILFNPGAKFPVRMGTTVAVAAERRRPVAARAARE